MEAKTSLGCDVVTKPPDSAAKTNWDATSDGTDCNGMGLNSTRGCRKEICAI